MSAEKPAIVIVPGAWHVPVHYKILIDSLVSAGYEAEALMLPSCGPPEPTPDMSKDVAVVRQAVEAYITRGLNVILVMHSLGGHVGTSASKGLRAEDQASGKGIVALVYIAAFVVPEGPALLDLSPTGTYHPFVRIVGEPGTGVFMRPDGLPTAETFYNDCTLEVQQAALRELEWNHSDNVARSKCEYSAWKEIESNYLICELDNALPLHEQETMLKQEGGRWKRIERMQAGHSPFLSRPEETASVALQYPMYRFCLEGGGLLHMTIAPSMLSVTVGRSSFNASCSDLRFFINIQTNQTPQGSSTMEFDAEDSSAIAMKIPSKDVFDFFRLPAEIRDKIYEESVVENIVGPPNYEIVRKVTGYAPSNLQLVNRQFRRELLERTSKMAWVVYEDQPQNSGWSWYLPAAPQHAHQVTLHLILGDEWDVKHRLHQHYNIKKVVGGFESLHGTYMNFYFDQVAAIEECVAALPECRSSILHGLRGRCEELDVNVYSCNYGCAECNEDFRYSGGRCMHAFDFTREKKLIMKLDYHSQWLLRADGQQEDAIEV